MANVIGEPFKEYVNSQIKKRQEIHGKKNRTIQEISYLNSTNSWVKLASGVSLSQERLDLLKTSYGNPLVGNTIPGKDLAINNVLFNGLTSVGDSYIDNEGNEKTTYNQVQRTNFLGRKTGAYGVGGNDFGIVPMPGITSVDSKDLNRGSIKRSQVQLKAYNKHQFDVIDVLYLRLGYTVLLEFGNNQYWDDKTNSLTQMGSTLIDTDFFKTNDNYYDLLFKIEKKRNLTRGNYDAILGKIVNFSWSFTPEGTYDIQLDIISIGDVIESLKVNSPTTSALNNKNLYANRQATLSQFQTRAADDPDQFYLIYPLLKEKLTEWYNTSRGKTEITMKFALGGSQIIRKTQRGRNDSSKILTTDAIITPNGEGGELLPKPLSNREFSTAGPNGEPQYVRLLENKDQGSISLVNFGKFFNTNTLADDALLRDNLNKNLFEAVKFAIITSVNGFYGGTNEKPQESTKSIRNYNSDPYVWTNENNNLEILGIVGKFISNDGDPQKNRQYSYNELSSDNNSKYRFRTTKAIDIDLLINKATFREGAKVGGISRDPKNPNTLIFNYPANRQSSTARLSALQFLVYGSILNVEGDNNFTGNDLPYIDPDDIKTLSDNQWKICTANLMKNIPLDTFLLLVYKYFAQNNAAGGPSDNAFKENPEYPSFSVELEYEKNKNRIYEWLYKVRKYYTGITQTQADLYKDITSSQEQGAVYGYLSVNKLKIGKILNPYDVKTIKTKDSSVSQSTFQSKLIKSWQDSVGYPNYSIESGNIDFVVLDSLKEEVGGSGVFDLDNRFKYFVRLKVLLEFIEDEVIPNIIPNSSITKLIKIDTDSRSNICYAIDNMISTDIRSCIIRNNDFHIGLGEKIQIFDGEPGLDYFLSKKDGFIYGRPMNVYMNFEFIQTTLDSIEGGTGEAVLFDFLSKICNEINKCLGYVNNLEPVIDQETNSIKIIDQTPIPGIDAIAKDLVNDLDQKVYPNFSTKEVTQLEVFGYNPTNQQSSFVHNIGLTTSISKEYASMITIGATANGAIPGSEATAFAKWNVGVTDRIKPEIVDPAFGKSSVEEATIQKQNEQIVKNYITFIQQNGDQERFKILGLDTNGTINKSYITTNISIVENFYKYAQSISSKEGSLESSVGFLPFNLQIDMEGISGMKIYQKIKVDTRFLPSNYPKTLDFIITGINHKLENDTWTTSLSTQATSIIKKDKEGKIINTPLLLDEDLVTSVKKERRPSSSDPDDRFLPYIPSGYKTKYTFPFTNTKWVGFKDTAQPLPYKEAIQYLNKTNPDIGKSVFAIMWAESAKNRALKAFKTPGGNNFSGVQTDNAVWTGTSKDGLSGPLTGQYGRIDSGKALRAFAMFDTPEKFLDFMIGRILQKKFPKGDDPDKWTRIYVDNWWSPKDKSFINNKSSGKKFLSVYKKTGNQVYDGKKAIYKTAVRIYNNNL